MKRKIFSIVLISILVLSLFQVSASCEQSSSVKKANILYYKNTNKSLSDFNLALENENITIQKTDNTEKIYFSEQMSKQYNAICLDGELAKNNQDTVNKYLQHLNKVLVIDSSLSKKELLDILNMCNDIYYEETDYSETNISNLKKLGYLVYTSQDGSIRIVTLNVESYEKKLIDTALNDAASFAPSTNEPNFGAVTTLTQNDWTSMNMSSGIDYYTDLLVRWSLQLYKDPANPVSGKYKTCSEFYVRPEVYAAYFPNEHVIGSCYLTVSGSSDSSILSVSPADRSSGDTSGSISISYPWGISFTLSGTNTGKISTLNGGVGSSQITKQFNGGYNNYQEAELLATAYRLYSSASYTGSYTINYSDVQWDGTPLGNFQASNNKTLTGNAAN